MERKAARYEISAAENERNAQEWAVLGEDHAGSLKDFCRDTALKFTKRALDQRDFIQAISIIKEHIDALT
jgi:hypothetical protein